MEDELKHHLHCSQSIDNLLELMNSAVGIHWDDTAIGSGCAACIINSQPKGGVFRTRHSKFLKTAQMTLQWLIDFSDIVFLFENPLRISSPPFCKIMSFK